MRLSKRNKPPQPKTKIIIMSKQLPAEGDYIAKCNGSLRVIESSKGTLGIEVPYVLQNSEPQGFAGNMQVWIAKADGTLQTAQIDNLSAVFGWNGKDPWELCFEDPDTQQKPRDYSSVEFKLADCKHESFTPEGKDESVTVFKPSWLNPLGGKSSYEPADRAEFMKKFGSKFRAASTTTKKPSAPPAGKKPGPPSKPAAPPCSMEEAWGACVEKEKRDAAAQKRTAKTEEELANDWYAKIAELCPEVPEANQDTLTKEQYGKLRAAFA